MNALSLPTTQDIFSLSRLVDGYPASRSEFIWAAREADFGSTMQEFLERFSSYHVFSTPKEFIDEAEALKLLIQEQQHSADEHLRSPQG